MFKIILMDYSMPEMDGPMAVTKMKTLFERNRINVSQQPYICCCSAYEDAALRKRADEAGMDHFMAKPVTKEELNTILDLLL